MQSSVNGHRPSYKQNQFLNNLNKVIGRLDNGDGSAVDVRIGGTEYTVCSTKNLPYEYGLDYDVQELSLLGSGVGGKRQASISVDASSLLEFCKNVPDHGYGKLKGYNGQRYILMQSHVYERVQNDWLSEGVDAIEAKDFLGEEVPEQDPDKMQKQVEISSGNQQWKSARHNVL